MATVLDRMAGDLVWAYAELVGTRDQNAQIKDALRRRQSRQVPSSPEMASR
ncbi:hypothetical protein ACQEVC_44635 [Plantactinospora sp. CA-294935]|uniref:hypothetical protein n=1 Tax=Plantactinospora sp. CA-294935 TaxID=3240012 RepID=UPI003D8DC21D